MFPLILTVLNRGYSTPDYNIIIPVKDCFFFSEGTPQDSILFGV